MTTKRVSVGALALSTAAIAVSYASAFLPGGAPPWSAWLLAMAIATSMVALMALGVSRPGRGVGRLAPALVTAFVLIAGAFALALWLPPERAGDALWLGFPRRAAVLLYGVGLLPLFVLPIAYAWSFDSQTLSDADLERVRAAVAAMRAGGPPQQHDRIEASASHHQSIAPAADPLRDAAARVPTSGGVQ